MQIKFLALYHNFKNEEYNKLSAQRELLSMWKNSIEQRQVKFITKATIQFQAYTFSDYPDQEKLIKELIAVYGHKDKQTLCVSSVCFLLLAFAPLLNKMSIKTNLFIDTKKIY